MSCYNDTVITINGGCRDNISVYVDETGQGIRPILNFISLLSSNYNLYQQVMSTVTVNSANWQETYDEVNLLQPLSAGWQETYDEVNTMQYNLTSNWQQTYEYVDLGIVNGGSF